MADPMTVAQAQEDADAAWAERFRSSATNLSQRRKYTQDIAAAADTRHEQENAQFERALAGNKGLRDLVMGREKMDQQERFKRQAQENADRQFRFQQEKQIFDEDMRQRKLELDEAQARRMMQKDMREIEQAKRMNDHLNNVENDINFLVSERGFLEGTPEFAQGVVQSVLRNPFIPKEYRDTLFKAAKIKGDPDTIVAQAKSLGLEPSGADFDPEDGNLVLRFKAPQQAKPETPKERDFVKEAATIRDQWHRTLANADKYSDKSPKKKAIEAEADRLFEELQAIRAEQDRAKSEKTSAAPPVGAAKAAPASPAAAKLPPGFSIVGEERE